MNVLVIEDDRVIGRTLEEGLREAGHDALWVRDGLEGEAHAAAGKFDAILLDLMLPGAGGLEVLGRLRAGGVRTPVIVLTALGSVEQRVAGLKAGADDYVVKPFAVVELLARLEAVCRRTSDRPAVVLEEGGLRLDLSSRKVTSGGTDIDLTPTEFSLLELLLRHAGQVVTRRMVCEHLWQADWEGTTNVVEVHINRLRGKLARCGKDALIHTVRGRGYAFRAPRAE